MRSLFHPLPALVSVLAIALSLQGCAGYMVTKAVTGTTSMVVGGTVGAVKLTGKAAGAVVGLAQNEDEQAE